MFLSVWMTRQLDAAPSSFRRALTKNVVHLTCADVTIHLLLSRLGDCPRLRALRSRVCVSARLEFHHVFIQSVIDPRRWSFAGSRGAARVPIPGRRAARPDEIASVTQGSGNMVALMPRIFFAVATVGIAVLITALILTALRL